MYWPHTDADKRILDLQVISFYSKPAAFFHNKQKGYGEVPDKFRLNFVELSVECFGLPNPELFASSNHHAKIKIREPPGVEFKTIACTERISRDACPSFVSRGFLNALSMRNSQKFARSVHIRVEIYSWDKPLGFAMFRLSNVLWSSFETWPVILLKEEHKPVYERSRRAKITLKADACAPVAGLGWWGIFALECSISLTLGSAMQQSDVLFTVLRETNKGLWIPIYRSKFEKTRNGRLVSFAIAYMPMIELLAGVEDRLLRIQLFEKGRSYPVLIGFSQFRIHDLASAVVTHSTLPWWTGRCNRASAGLRVNKFLPSSQMRFTHLEFIHSSESKAQSPAAVSFEYPADHTAISSLLPTKSCASH